MADTTYGYTPGSGALAAIDRIASTDYPYYKIKWGAPGTVNDASAANPFPVAVIGSATISGTVAATQSGTWNTNATLGAETTKKIGVVGIDPAQLSALGQAASAASVSIVPANDYGVPLATDKMFAGTTALTPLFAPIAVSASGANTIVALVSSKKIRVLSMKVTANGAVNGKWQSSTAGDKTGLSYFAAAGDGEVLPFNPVGWFETAAGESLILNLSAAVAVGGHLTYVTV
jgi:hypothetical protein